MNVSTLACSSDLMLVKIVAQKIKATGMNARTFVGSIASRCEMRPRRCAALTATAVPKSCAQRMKDGAATLCTAYLLPMSSVALQSM